MKCSEVQVQNNVKERKTQSRQYDGGVTKTTRSKPQRPHRVSYNLVTHMSRPISTISLFASVTSSFLFPGLAVSDALFCLAVLPSSYVGAGSFGFYGFGLRILYAAHGIALINTFILSSTWLTVAMAVSRYVAICHPLRARQVLGGRAAAVWTLIGVFGASVVVSAPHFLRNTIDSIPCAEGGRFYFVDNGWLAKRKSLETAYQWSVFVVGILLPFVVLIFCNVNLVAALRRSVRMRLDATGTGSSFRKYSKPEIVRVRFLAATGTGTGLSRRTGGDGGKAANRVTLTLIVIVVMYFILVLPSEVMTFLNKMILTNIDHLSTYNVVLAIANAFQAINFSFNFLLYCAVNSQTGSSNHFLFCSRYEIRTGSRIIKCVWMQPKSQMHPQRQPEVVFSRDWNRRWFEPEWS